MTAFQKLVIMIGCMCVLGVDQVQGQMITTFAGGHVRDGQQASQATLRGPSGVAVDSVGNIYIADTEHHRIRKVSFDGTITTLAGTGEQGFSFNRGRAILAKLNQPMGIALDGEGNVYFADTFNNRIRKIDADGIMTTVAGSGESRFAGDGGDAREANLNAPRGLAFDTAGNLYISDTYNNRIRMVDAFGIISTVAGNGSFTSSGDGGPATNASLFNPMGIHFDGAGNLLIAEQETRGNRIRKVDPQGTISTVIGQETQRPIGHPSGITTDKKGQIYILDWQGIHTVDTSGVFSTLVAGLEYGFFADTTFAGTGVQLPGGEVVVDQAGNLYFTDRLNHTIRKRLPNGTVEVVAGGDIGDGGLAADGYLYTPHNIYVDSLGIVWVSEQIDGRVRKIDANGIMTTVAGNGKRGFFGDGGLATKAQLDYPGGVFVDSQGILYIADTGNVRIRQVTPDGIISTLAGMTYSFPRPPTEGQPAEQAYLSAPADVWRAGDELFITVSGDSRIYKRDHQGIMQHVAGRGGSGGGLGDGGLATQALLRHPTGLFRDKDDNLYVADSFHNRIRVIDSSGRIQTVAGSGSGGAFGDGGAATSAGLNSPSGVYVDDVGNIFIADSGNHRIRKVNRHGIISTYAGTGQPGFSGDGGRAFEAQFDRPTDIFGDGDGNLYVVDHNNNRVRKISPATRQLTLQVTPDTIWADGLDFAVLAGEIVDLSGQNAAPSLGWVNFTSFDSVKIGRTQIPVDSIRTTLTTQYAGEIQIQAVTTEGLESSATLFAKKPSRQLQMTFFPEVPYTGSADSVIVQVSLLLANGQVDVADDSSSVFLRTHTHGLVLRDSFKQVSNGVFQTVLKSSVFGWARLSAVAQQAIAVHSALKFEVPPPPLPEPIDVPQDSGRVSTIAGGDTGHSLRFPWSVSVDPWGNVYIADTGHSKIHKVSRLGVFETIAGTDQFGFSGDGVRAIQAQLGRSESVFTDGLGNVYIAESSGRVRKVDTQGIIRTVAGNGQTTPIQTESPLGDGQRATDVQLIPGGIFVDRHGNLFISDTAHQRVRKVDTQGIITTVAGDGFRDESFQGRFFGDGGPATEASLNFPKGIFVDHEDNLYIADMDNHRIRKVDTQGIITTVAGTGNTGFSGGGFWGDGGPATEAAMSRPYGVVVDGAGQIFIADSRNHRIRKVDAQGMITTLVGDGLTDAYDGLQDFGDGKLAQQVRLNTPYDLALAPNGDLFVADSHHHLIRRVAGVAAQTVLNVPMPEHVMRVYVSRDTIVADNLDKAQLRVQFQDFQGRVQVNNDTTIVSMHTTAQPAFAGIDSMRVQSGEAIFTFQTLQPGHYSRTFRTFGYAPVTVHIVAVRPQRTLQLSAHPSQLRADQPDTSVIQARILTSDGQVDVADDSTRITFVKQWGQGTFFDSVAVVQNGVATTRFRDDWGGATLVLARAQNVRSDTVLVNVNHGSLTRKLDVKAVPERFFISNNAIVKIQLLNLDGTPVLPTAIRSVKLRLVSGQATLSDSIVTVVDGSATTQITSQKVGDIQIRVLAAGSETSTLWLKALAPVVSDSTNTGQMALDLDLRTGYQNSHLMRGPFKDQALIGVDLVAVSGAAQVLGFQAVLQYDPIHLEFVSFQQRDLMAEASVLPPDDQGGFVEINAAILGGKVTRDAGSLGHVIFKVRKQFQSPQPIVLVAGVLGFEDLQQTLLIHENDGVITLGDVDGSANTAGPSATAAFPDFDGDLQVGFPDFILFASHFGRTISDANFNLLLDLDRDGAVGFPDFILFAQAFGLTRTQ